jgi:addiction module HigA family antidote
MMRKLRPVTPGELLLEEFLKPMGISQYRLAKEIGVPAQRIGDIVAGKRAITADTGCVPKLYMTPKSLNVRWDQNWQISSLGPGWCLIDDALRPAPKHGCTTILSAGRSPQQRHVTHFLDSLFIGIP